MVYSEQSETIMTSLQKQLMRPLAEVVEMFRFNKMVLYCR